MLIEDSEWMISYPNDSSHFIPSSIHQSPKVGRAAKLLDEPKTILRQGATLAEIASLDSHIRFRHACDALGQAT
jgi:hypothetical protein